MTDTETTVDDRERAFENEADASSANAPESPSVENPKEAIETLLAEARGLKPVFLGVIDCCREPQRAETVDARYEELTEFNRCTFSSVRVRALLEEAGALSYVEPETSNEAVEENSEYLQVTHRPEGWWVATEAGIEAVDSIDHVQDTLGMFEDNASLKEELLGALRLLEDSPLSLSGLEEKLDGKNLAERTGKSVAFLVKHLEDCGAIEYRGKWTITEPGKTALAQTAGN